MDDLWPALARWWRPFVAATVGLALFGATALATAAGDDAIVARLEAAAADARTSVGGVLTSELAADEVADAIDAADFPELYVVLRAEVLTDPTIMRVRIWSPEGEILFSTGDRAEIGTAPAGDRPLADVMSGETVSRDITEPFTAATAGLDPRPRRMWQTWLPLVTRDRTEPQGVVQVDQDRAAVVAGAGAGSARLAATLQVLAIVALILAVAMVVTTTLVLRHDEEAVAVPDPGEEGAWAADEEAALALSEVAHERDVSIARASDAEERARLADDRLASFAPLQQRVEIAERRALDAERRLDEIDEQVVAATNGDVAEATVDIAVPDSGGVATDGGSSGAGSGTDEEPASERSAAARQSAELRARLARTAARKKRAGGNT